MGPRIGIVKARAKGFLEWLFVDPWPVWLGIGVPFAILKVTWLVPYNAELKVRIAGYAITLLGVLLVVKGIHDKSRLFRLPAVTERAVRWMRRLPGFFARTTTINAKVQATLGGTLGATGTVTATLIPGEATLERRVTILEESVRRVNERITEGEAERKKEVRLLQQARAAEATAREEGDRRLQEQVKDLSVGGVDFEWAGVLWVLVGSTLTTFPGEIAGLIQRE